MTIDNDYELTGGDYDDTLKLAKSTTRNRLFLAILFSFLTVAGPGSVAVGDLLVAPKAVPRTIGEVNLKGLIQGFGKSLADEGKFFGWGPSKITKSISDFTKDGLLKAGWTKERLSQVAEAYEHITRITPSNPSAAGRAAQLRELIEKLF